jgi:hypothetical protein
MLGKMLHTKKADKKSLMSKSKVKWQAQVARLEGERWHSVDSGLGVAFIKEGA